MNSINIKSAKIEPAMTGVLLNQRYRLDRELGQGGMGVVFRAHDTLLSRDVAIKLLNKASLPGLGTEGRARLLREAQLIAQLNHPGIVSIYDAGQHSETPYVVMELIEGDSLNARQITSLEQIIAIARQVCAALAHAHEHGIVHRDLKPENVLITRSAVVKLTDFGLARSLASRLSAEGVIVGTVFYMAPELALGQAFDGRADLYALGVILYELCTGKLPFTADDPLAVISQHLYAPVISPRALNPDIPKALDELIVRLMSKLPEDRPADARQVEEALGKLDLLNKEPAAASQLTVLDRMARGKLVGRERELAEMINLWQATAQGNGQVLLVSGEPGIGKTRLVRELMTHAAISRGKVFIGESYPEGSMPYGPVAQVLRESLGRAAESAPTLPNYVSADLVKMAPDLNGLLGPAAPDNPHDPQIEPNQIFESFAYWCTLLTAEHPALFVFEDVHWADPSTLKLLRSLARRARRMRLMLVITYREVELTDTNNLQTLLHDFSRERLATRMKLTRLTRQQTADMLSSLLTVPALKIDDVLLDAIYRETEGNPFFVEEVCKALVEEGQICQDGECWTTSTPAEIEIPQSVRLTIQARLARLPGQTQDVLRIASILGREFDFDVLKHACDYDEDTLVDALETAERALIINEAPRSRAGATVFAFAHALFPTTLRDSISGIRRQRMHARVASAILKLRPEDYNALAYHYEQSGGRENARDNYIRAAAKALSVYANQEAERAYRSALELTPPGLEQAPLLADLGEALFRQSHYAAAGDTWQESIELYRQSGNHEQVARLYARSARAVWYASDAPRGLELCRAGLAAVHKMTNSPQPVETPGMAALLHETARACRFNGLNDEALPLCNQALEMAQRLDLVEVQADALATLGILENQTPEQRRKALNEAVELAESANLLAIASRANLNLGGHLQEVGDIVNARKHYLRARDLARKMGIAAWEHGFLGSAVDASLELGEFSAAEQAIAEMYALHPFIPDPTVAVFHVRLVETRRLQMMGNWEQAIIDYRACLDDAVQRSDVKYQGIILTMLADTYLDTEQWEEATRILAEAEQLHPDNESEPGHRVTTSALQAVTLAFQKDLPQARQLLAAARAHLPTPNIREIAMLAWVEAIISYKAGNWQEALDAFATAARTTSRLGMRWIYGRILLYWAAAHAERQWEGDLNRARELLRQALATFQKLPAPGYAAAAQKRLQQLP